MNVNIIHCHSEAEVVTWIVMFLDVFRFCFEKAELNSVVVLVLVVFL